MKAIVIGGVAAGMSAASKLRRVMPDAQITVYERGGYLSYGACGLPYYIGGFNDDPGRLIARTREQYAQMRIDTFLHHEVLSVDAAAKRVRVRDNDSGREFEDSYDALMIAVGCDSVAPKVPGADLPSVFYLKTMEDGLLLRDDAGIVGILRAVQGNLRALLALLGLQAALLVVLFQICAVKDAEHVALGHGVADLDVDLQGLARAGGLLVDLLDVRALDVAGDAERVCQVHALKRRVACRARRHGLQRALSGPDQADERRGDDHDDHGEDEKDFGSLFHFGHKRIASPPLNILPI